MTGRLIRPAMGLMLSLVVAACAQGQSNPTGPGASTGPSGGASGSFTPAASPAADLGSAELSLRQEIRTRAGLVNIGPGALEVAALMDKSESVALKALKADASGSTFQAPKFQVAKVMLADVPTPGQSITGPVTILTTDFATEMAQGPTNTRSLDDNPFPDAFINDRSGSKTETQHGCTTGNCDGPAVENVTVAGNPGQIFTQTTLTAGYDGSSISMDIKIETYGNITNPTTHATVYRIESTGTGHIDGDACPDASGNTKLHIEFTAKENYFIAADPAGGSAGYGLEQSYSADVNVKADDNANLAGIDIAVKAHAESKGGGRGAGDSQSELRTFSNDAAGSQTFGYNPTSGFTNGTDTVQPTSTDGLFFITQGTNTYLTLPAKAAAKATETAWRSGMCIRVSASPNGGDVGKDSVTSVKVTVKQRYEGTELDKPVEAVSFSGVKSIDPAAGQKQPAPATFRYTAGSTDGDKGGVIFKSVSNRGIGQTGVTFVVGGPTRLRGSADMKTDFANGPARWTSQSHASDVVWQLDPNSRMRPANSDPADKISVFTIVSGQLAWSYEGSVSDGVSINGMCTVRDSGTATLGANSDQQQAYLFIDWTKQPATYSFQGAVTGLSGAKCMDSNPQSMDSVWAWSDPNKDPTVSGTDAAFVLEGTYHFGGSYAGTISDTYSWSFSSEP
jgi:hypothetical protein